jgi:hypothetical protein
LFQTCFSFFTDKHVIFSSILLSYANFLYNEPTLTSRMKSDLKLHGTTKKITQ